MQKLMPIVPGCRAIITGVSHPDIQELSGREVECIRRVERGEFIPELKGTVSDGPIPAWLVTAPNLVVRGERGRSSFAFSADFSIVSEGRLMRIDGGDFGAEMFQESLEDLEWVLSEAERLKKQISSEK